MRFGIKAAVLSAFMLAGVCSALAYDEKLSQKAVYYSIATFCGQDDLENWQCGKSCAAVQGVSKVTKVQDYNSGVFGYVGYNSKDDEIIVAFRGSDNIANWISNIDFLQISYKTVTGAKAHRGFYLSY